jgi:putative transposase
MSAELLSQIVDYVHTHPVKRKLVSRPREWPYSSFHVYVSGLCRPDWAGDVGEPMRDSGGNTRR